MGRPERPLDGTSGPIVAFAQDLRALRNQAGNPSYRELARTALFAPSVLSSAASGHKLPTLAVTLAFVAACGGDRARWERRWREVAEDVGAAVDIREDAEPAGPARPAQLPMGPAVFLGRGQALAAAGKLLGEGRTPLVVTGPVGVGKTAFALRLADDLAAAFPDGQLYADLGQDGPDAPEVIVGDFLRVLGVPAAQVPDDATQRLGLYRSLLAQRKLFVLLDNARDERQVRPLLARSARSQVVVTSRARLLGLDGARRVELDAFARAESVALIGRLAGAERVQAEYEATEAIAELCGGLPLAVNIAGRMIAARPEWSIAHTAELLADHDRLMDTLEVGDVSVRDHLASALRQLSPAGRQALFLVARGGAGWTTAIALAAAMTVCLRDADDLLESLVDAGLLTRGGVASRYRVATLVAVFAADAERDAGQRAPLLVERRARRGFDWR
ncbi:NB-ARC domain-containing protein [Actinokineospora sp. NPDC004072]